MKKTYLKPQFKVVDMKGRPKLLVGSNKRVTTVHSNLRTLDDPDEDDITFGGAAGEEIIAR